MSSYRYMLFHVAILIVSCLLFITSTPVSAAIVFMDDFENTTNGENAAVTVSALSASIGTWVPLSTGSGINDHDDFGEIIGNGIGAASTDNAILIDTGDDNDGSDILGSANNTNTILQGDFTKGFNTNSGTPTVLEFSWLWYSTRVAGNTNNNQRNMRISLNSGNSREVVIVLETHNGSTNDIVWRNGDDNMDDNIVHTMNRPSTSRLDGGYSDSFATAMILTVNGIDGTLSLSVDEDNDGSFEVTDAQIGYNDGTLTKDLFLNNFELFVGGANSGNKGAFFDDFKAEVIPEPSSLTLFSLAGMLALRRNRK